jgi:hypothetical protein
MNPATMAWLWPSTMAFFLTPDGKLDFSFSLLNWDKNGIKIISLKGTASIFSPKK